MLRKILNLAILILISSAILTNAQNYFEGKVKFKITDDDDESHLMEYFLKDGNFRITMFEDEDVSAIFIYKKENSYILMPEDKMYMNLNNSLFSKLGDMFKKNDEEENEKDKKEFNFENYKTGKTKTFLGYDCDQWINKSEFDDDNYEVEAWITDELGNFIFMENPMGAGYSPTWGSSLKDKGYFPLQVITKNSDGEVISTFEAVEINKQSLSNDLFEIPSDYNEMKIPGM
ncbi:MAG: DUF4412 domain-containing protein [Ignavibacteriae bacterium]|nr:DUF4412 domain-containing protein [Ignavibacteriota bacterium]